MTSKRKKKAAPAKLNAFETEVPPPTESELIAPLPEDLTDAWDKLRAFAGDLGEQRIYTSASAIMFARRVCYLFVRPKKSYLQLNFILPKLIESDLIKRGNRLTESRAVNTYKLVHADQVEEPLTDWIRAAYDFVK